MERDEDTNRLAAAAIVDVSQIPPFEREKFAELICRTMVEVFGIRESDARQRVWRVLDTDEGGANVFTYHFTPLQIAADLALTHDRPISQDELERYRAILASVEP